MFAICESEGIRHSTGDGFGSAVGDDGDGSVEFGEEVGEERVLTGYECLLSETAETQLTGQSLKRDFARQQHSKVRTMKAKGGFENWMHSTSG